MLLKTLWNSSLIVSPSIHTSPSPHSLHLLLFLFSNAFMDVSLHTVSPSRLSFSYALILIFLSSHHLSFTYSPSLDEDFAKQALECLIVILQAANSNEGNTSSPSSVVELFHQVESSVCLITLSSSLSIYPFLFSSPPLSLPPSISLYNPYTFLSFPPSSSSLSGCQRSSKHLRSTLHSLHHARAGQRSSLRWALLQTRHTLTNISSVIFRNRRIFITSSSAGSRSPYYFNIFLCLQNTHFLLSFHHFLFLIL